VTPYLVLMEEHVMKMVMVIHAHAVKVILVIIVMRVGLIVSSCYQMTVLILFLQTFLMKVKHFCYTYACLSNIKYPKRIA